jgi:hypothetical protein
MSRERARRRAEREREQALAQAGRERRRARARRRAAVAGSVGALFAAVTRPWRRRTRWRGAGGPPAERRRAQNRLIAAFFLAVQALVWLFSPSWAVRVSALVLSVLLLPVFVTLIYDRRS